MNNISQQLIKYAKDRGFVLVRETRHIVMRRGSRTVSFSKSPSDWRVWVKARKDIDRALRSCTDLEVNKETLMV